MGAVNYPLHTRFTLEDVREINQAFALARKRLSDDSYR